MLIEKEVFEMENLKNEPFPVAVLLLEETAESEEGLKGCSFLKVFLVSVDNPNLQNS